MTNRREGRTSDLDPSIRAMCDVRPLAVISARLHLLHVAMIPAYSTKTIHKAPAVTALLSRSTYVNDTHAATREGTEEKSKSSAGGARDIRKHFSDTNNNEVRDGHIKRAKE